jgi:hypothetical protein
MQSHLEGTFIPTPLTTTEIKEKLSALYPLDDEQDVLPDGDLDPEGLTITPPQVEQMIKTLNRRSCHGSSAWTNVAICRLMRPPLDKQDTSVVQTFTRMINMLCAGRIHPIVGTMWATSRAALLPKNDGGWRPLGIGEAWYRLVGRIVASIASPALARTLLPLQYAVGVKGGVEIAARMAQLAYDFPNDCVGGEEREEMSILRIDTSNAFNTLSRSKMFSAVIQHAPGLARLVRALYGCRVPFLR